MKQKTYNKADALKMMIDGELMTAKEGTKGYLKFTGSTFSVYRRSDDSLWEREVTLSDDTEYIKYVPKPNFKIGDRVKCAEFGRGEVLDIARATMSVKFNTQPLTFTFVEIDNSSIDIDLRLSLDTDYLGTTVDGVDIYDKNTPLWYVYKPTSVINKFVNVIHKVAFKESIECTGFFSTFTAAQEWVDANKPKEIVGITLDGVKIEKGKKYTLWSVAKNGEVFYACLTWDQKDFSGLKHYCLALGYQRFSTQEAAESWKEKNLVGVTEDGWHVWKGDVRVLYYIDYIYSELKESHPTNDWGLDNSLHFEHTENTSNYFESRKAAQAHLDEYLELRRRNAGNYVVLLSEYEGSSNFAKNYVFKMEGKAAKDEFNVQFDRSGNSNGMGYSAARIARTRLATSDEVKAYEIAGKPIHIDEVEEILKPKVRFEVGDDVIHPGYGEGIVTRIVSDLYSIRVEFNRNYTYFTEQGKFNNSDVAPTLTFKPGTKPFRVGQKVRCLLYGEGEVVSGSYDEVFPIRVEFTHATCYSYTSDGKWRTDFNPTLFHIVE